MGSRVRQKLVRMLKGTAVEASSTFFHRLKSCLAAICPSTAESVAHVVHVWSRTRSCSLVVLFSHCEAVAFQLWAGVPSPSAQSQQASSCVAAGSIPGRACDIWPTRLGSMDSPRCSGLSLRHGKFVVCFEQQ